MCKAHMIYSEAGGTETDTGIAATIPAGSSA